MAETARTSPSLRWRMRFDLDFGPEVKRPPMVAKNEDIPGRYADHATALLAATTLLTERYPLWATLRDVFPQEDN